MAQLFRITGSLERRRVLWFVNRSCDGEGYALDELFTTAEAGAFLRLLQSRNEAYRIEAIPSSLSPEELASWNLLGRIFELAREDAAQLTFRVAGCAEA